MSDFLETMDQATIGNPLSDAGYSHTLLTPQRRVEELVAGIVLAGGTGTRLAPLTAGQAKPAVAFGPNHRIIDFALSNLVNSGVRSIHVLVQHHARSVKDHLRLAWQTQASVIAAIQPRKATIFKGTADAVRQSLDLLNLDSATLVLVFGADHVYRMDVMQMIAFHRARRADVTVAALPVPVAQARAFGVIGCHADGRIHSFVEKPQVPPAIPGDPLRALASLGNYVFTADALLRALREPRGREEPDFGKDVLPRLLTQKQRLFAYDFTSNRIPGQPQRSAYWRDVGTIDAYWAASLDTLGTPPAFELFNPQWPIHGPVRSWPPARLVRSSLANSHIGAGALVRGATVRDSIVRRAAVVNDRAELDQCILMDHCTIGSGARLRRAIVDRHAVVPANACIGFDLEQDSKLWTVTSDGVTVVTAGGPDSGRS